MGNAMNKKYAHLWEQVKDNDVKFIKLWFTDILGFLKSFSMPGGRIGEGAWKRASGLTGRPSGLHPHR